MLKSGLRGPWCPFASAARHYPRKSSANQFEADPWHHPVPYRCNRRTRRLICSNLARYHLVLGLEMLGCSPGPALDFRRNQALEPRSRTPRCTPRSLKQTHGNILYHIRHNRRRLCSNLAHYHLGLEQSHHESCFGPKTFRWCKVRPSTARGHARPHGGRELVLIIDGPIGVADVVLVKESHPPAGFAQVQGTVATSIASAPLSCENSAPHV